MKRFVLVASLTALLVIALLWVFFPHGRNVTSRVVGQEELKKIEKELKPAGEDMEFTLTCQGNELAYDSNTRTFFLPKCSEFKESKSFDFDSLRSNSTDFEVLFTKELVELGVEKLRKDNTAIPFMVVKEGTYSWYNLKITGVSTFSITGTENSSSEGLPVYAVSLWDSEAVGNPVTTCFTTSRIHGNTSQNYEKLSLRLNLLKQKKDGTFESVNHNLLGIRDDNDWILNSLYADSSRMRDKLAIDLWSETGATDNPYGQHFGTKAEYVEVFINDSYQGLYLLMSPIDKKQLGMDAVSDQMAAGSPVIERIYKKKYTAVWDSQDFVGPLPDPQTKDFRGGFFLKGDTILENEEEWSPLYDLASCMEADDQTFTKEITGLADQNSVLDNWLYYQAIAGFDNSGKNFYYVTKNKNGRCYGYFIPWDMNLSFGDVYADNVFYSENKPEVVTEEIPWEPAGRMLALNVEDSAALAAQKWEEWRQGVFSDEAMTERIDGLEQTITDSGAMAREMERWPSGNADPDTTGLREFTTKRLAYVDSLVAEYQHKPE